AQQTADGVAGLDQAEDHSDERRQHDDDEECRPARVGFQRVGIERLAAGREYDDEGIDDRAEQEGGHVVFADAGKTAADRERPEQRDEGSGHDPEQRHRDVELAEVDWHGRSPGARSWNYTEKLYASQSSCRVIDFGHSKHSNFSQYSRGAPAW